MSGTALVTGAGGFIGKALIRQLAQQGLKVIALASSDGDIASAATWANLPAADTVYHLAGKSFVPDSWNQSTEFMRVNVIGTEQALSYCRQHGASLVLASTYVYGTPQQLPVSEAHPLNPNNPYAVSKRLAEELCEFASRYQAVSTATLRLFNIYGRGQRESFLIPTILNQIEAGKEIRVKDLKPKRDYLYITDAVNALALAGRLEGHHIFNIGAGISSSVQEIIDTAQMVAGTRLPVYSENVTRPNEVMDVVADITKATATLGWKPQQSLEQGLRAMLQPEPAL